MISIVISTSQSEPWYLKHITKTCGVANADIVCYEKSGARSLGELYNRGLAESKYDVVVFLQDDIEFDRGSQWGFKIWNHFNNSHYGILGKAGSTYLHESGVWWHERSKGVGHVNYDGVHPKTGKPGKWLMECSTSFPDRIVPVAVVDGMFIAAHKRRIKHRFSADLDGFYFWDIDFCVANHLEGVAIGVVFDFPITKKYSSSVNPDWEAARKKIAGKYAGALPISVPVELYYSNQEVSIKKQPWVSIIVPTKGKTELVSGLIESILRATRYDNFEVILADTGSTPEEKRTLRSLVATANDSGRGHFKMVEYDYYNFAKINNDVVRHHSDPNAELLIFCNNDVVFINDCISHMVRVYLNNRPACGTVGARLHYPDNTVQHSGIYLTNIQQPRPWIDHFGYRSAYQYFTGTRQVLANTAALLLVNKAVFAAAGGFNENYLGCYEDVELNMALIVRNYKNYLCGEAVACHLESQTRVRVIDPHDELGIFGYIHRNARGLSKYLSGMA